jgi:rRNA maturation protein Rpf1
MITFVEYGFELCLLVKEDKGGVFRLQLSTVRDEKDGLTRFTIIGNV